MTGRPSVTLNDMELRIVRHVAQSRNAANQAAAGVTNYRMGPESDEEIDRVGFGGELAFCKLFNVYPDFEIGPRRGGFDAERFGQAVDVKATKYPNGHLLAVLHKRELRADVYALFIVQGSIYTFAGFATADALFTDARIRDLGRGNGYAMPQGELTADQIRWST